MTGAGSIVLEILDGGLLTTVQDAGRQGWAHLAVPESGAADPWSLAVANVLVGNDPNHAALEMTLAGPTVRARVATTIGLAGADLGARIRGGRRLGSGRSHRLAEGDVVEIPGDGATNSTGARGYLAVPGGLDVPVVLGSRATCLTGGFGGLDGRPLRAGDLLGTAAPPADQPPEVVWPEPDAGTDGAGGMLRVIPTAVPGLEALAAATWLVAPAADRVGIRLEADLLPTGIGGETITHGVVWGAIQVPPDGRPILLGPDHHTTGGYRVVGVVITADRPRLGQLRPGGRVRLEIVDRETAVAALLRQRDTLAGGLATLRESSRWDALTHAAGG